MALGVLNCGDHDMVRDALAKVLDDVDDFQIVITCSAVEDTISYLKQNPKDADVAVIDVRRQDDLGHNVTHWVKNHRPDIRIVLLTAFMDDELLVEAYTSGTDAIVLKGSPTLAE